ncbi:hypothetical protein GO730_10605 [Spirosoma sp. HMF3257]|uniref:hypothetical protein n=1 Tax=Spirosoma telluris TaxID=2183553 RepID=UPI0011B93C5A|nr:hypothetical protein [Spirosoma telluris]
MLLLSTLCSCQPQQPFDKNKWGEEGDLMDFPNRKYMIDDLVTHYTLKGKTYKEIISLLGESNYSPDSTYSIAYRVDIDWGAEDPVYSKDLVIYFSRDSLVQFYRLKEWKK